MALDSSNVWTYLVFYDPTLTIAFFMAFFRFSRGFTGQPVSLSLSFGGLFWIFMGNLKQLVKEGVKAQLGQGTAEVHLA